MHDIETENENYESHVSFGLQKEKSIPKYLHTVLAHVDQSQRERRARMNNLSRTVKDHLQALLSKTEHQQDLSVLRTEVRELVKQIDRTLEYGFRSVGSAMMFPPTIDVGSIIREFISTFERIFRGTLIDLRTSTEQAIRLRIDVRDFRLIIGPLIHNAARSAASRVRVSIATGESTIILTIEDDREGEDTVTERVNRGTGGVFVREQETAVAHELVAGVYNGSLLVDRSPDLGGTRTQIEISRDCSVFQIAKSDLK